MPNPAEGAPPARNASAPELLPSWWEHRALFFIIIVSINFAAFFIYFLTFLGEGSTPLFSFSPLGTASLA